MWYLESEMSYRMAILEHHRQRQIRKKREMRKEAERLALDASKEFRFRKMYLHGSTVNSRPVSVWSDIDLVVEGLPEEDFYSLVGFLNSRSGFEIDLKAYEALQSRLKDTLAYEGIAIYEKR